MSNSDDIELTNIINCCENLEELEISSMNRKLSLIDKIKLFDLKSIKLKLKCDPENHGYFEMIDPKFLADFKEHGKKLNFFICNYCNFGEGVTLEKIEKELNEIFTKVEV
jgi:hypothetical protein